MKMKEFEGLMWSEIKKVNKFASRRDHSDSCVTGYSCNTTPDELGFIEVRCEICSHDMSIAEDDVILEVFMPDRRRSFVAESLSR